MRLGGSPGTMRERLSLNLTTIRRASDRDSLDSRFAAGDSSTWLTGHYPLRYSDDQNCGHSEARGIPWRKRCRYPK